VPGPQPFFISRQAHDKRVADPFARLSSVRNMTFTRPRNIEGKPKYSKESHESDNKHSRHCSVALTLASGVASIWVLTVVNCRRVGLVAVRLCTGQSAVKKLNCCKLRGARAPVPHSWRRQCY